MRYLKRGDSLCLKWFYMHVIQLKVEEDWKGWKVPYKIVNDYFWLSLLTFFLIHNAPPFFLLFFLISFRLMGIPRNNLAVEAAVLQSM